MNQYQLMKAALGLPEDAPDEEVAKAVMSSITATANASKALAEQQKQIDALMNMPKVGVVSVTEPDEDEPDDSKSAGKSKSPDFGDAYSPDVVMEMQQQIVDLQARLSAKELESAKAKLDALIDRGQREGKLATPNLTAWARSISVSQQDGRQVIDTSKLEAFLMHAPAINALVGSQTGGVSFEDEFGLTASQQMIARNLGLTAEQYKAQLKAKGAN